MTYKNTHTRIEQVISNVKTRLKWPPLQCFRHVQKPRNLRWKIGHKHTHGLHTNTHTDCTKHTHGLHTNTHILLLIVVFALKTGTKRHTYLERKSIFFWRGAPATENKNAFFGHPGRPRHRKIRYFWRPGALSQKNTHTDWPRGRFSPFRGQKTEACDWK